MDGSSLVSISVAHRPAGYGRTEHEALILVGKDKKEASIFELRHKHEDSEFGVYHSSGFAIEGNNKIHSYEENKIENFAIFVELNGGWERQLPDSYDQNKSIAFLGEKLPPKVEELRSGFLGSVAFLKERATNKSERVEKEIATQEARDEKKEEFTNEELQKLIKFIPPISGSKAVKIIVSGVDLFFDRSHGEEIFVTTRAKDGSRGGNAVRDFFCSKHLMLTKVLFGIKDPTKLEEFITEFGAKKVSELKDEYGRNIFHHLLESAKTHKDRESAAKLIGVLMQKLSSDQVAKMAIAGDSFHFKTPLSIAVTKPFWSDLSLQLIKRIPKADINQPDLCNNTPLHWAVISQARNPDPQTVKIIGELIKSGGNPNITDKSQHEQSAVQVAFEALKSTGIPKAGRGQQTHVARVAVVDKDGVDKNSKISCLATVLLGSLYQELKSEGDNKHLRKSRDDKRLFGNETEGFWRQHSGINFGFSATTQTPYVEFAYKAEGGKDRLIKIFIGANGVEMYERVGDGYQVRKFGENHEANLIAKIADLSTKMGIKTLGGVEVQGIEAFAKIELKPVVRQR